MTARHQRILVVEAEEALRRQVRAILEPAFEVICADDLRSGRSLLARVEFGALLVEQELPDGEGLALLSSALRQKPHVGRILLTADGATSAAIEAMRNAEIVGYLARPLEPERLLQLVGRAVELGETVRTTCWLAAELVRLGQDEAEVVAGLSSSALEPLARRVRQRLEALPRDPEGAGRPP